MGVEFYELGLLVRVLRSVDGVTPLVQVAIKMLGVFRQLSGHDAALAHQLCAGIVDDLLATEGEARGELQRLRPICTAIMMLLTKPWQVERQRVEWATRRVVLRKARKHWPRTIGVPGVCKDEWSEYYDLNPHHLPDMEKAIGTLREGSRNEVFQRAKLPVGDPAGVLYDRLTRLPVWNPSNYVVANQEVMEARERSSLVDLLLKLGSYLSTGFDPDQLFSGSTPDPLGFVHAQPGRNPALPRRTRVYGVEEVVPEAEN